MPTIDPVPRLPALSGRTRADRAIEAIRNTFKNLNDFQKRTGMVTYATLQNWKKNVYQPTDHYLKQLSAHTGYTMRELRGEGDDEVVRYACPYAAWRDFERTPQYREASPDELRQMAAYRFRSEPTLAEYLALYSITANARD